MMLHISTEKQSSVVPNKVSKSSKYSALTDIWEIQSSISKNLYSDYLTDFRLLLLTQTILASLADFRLLLLASNLFQNNLDFKRYP
ncbi:unnamed protein product [Rhizophagus irregularis]|nr:unnamed protein product [Rhizophagus irregularis]CAB4420153.1 unnamed protein product [Rhizophagus irregularis]